MTFPSVKTLLLIWDVLSAIAAPILAFYLRYWHGTISHFTATSLLYVVFSAIGTITLLKVSGAFNVAWRFFSMPDAIDALSSISLGVVVAIATSFFHDRLDGIPRALPFIQIIMQFFAYSGARYFLKRLANHLQPNVLRPTNVLLIGCNQTTYIYARAVESVGQRSIRMVGALTHDPGMVGHTLRGIPIVATFDRIDEVIGKFSIHGQTIRKFILSANEAEMTPHLRERILAAAEREGIQLVDIHSLFAEVTGFIDEAGEFSVDVIELRGGYWPVKRALDAFGAGALLILLSPLLFTTAVIVALDMGFPVVFWQERPGRHGKPIFVYKFRSMRDGVDRNGRPLADHARTSKLGYFLRKTRLDELPQLWNILRGDMSFIGPRPLLLVDQPEEASQRLAARPGVSGWAQVNGGRIISPDEKRALDLYYIAHASLGRDLQIVWRTLVMIVMGDRRDETEIQRALSWVNDRDITASLQKSEA